MLKIEKKDTPIYAINFISSHPQLFSYTFCTIAHLMKIVLS